MKVLHIIPDLEYGNAARQLSWLAPVLKRSGTDCRICVLSGIGPLAGSFADVPLEHLGWNRWVDLKPIWRLRRVLADFKPDLIHCWRQESVRALIITDLLLPRRVARPESSKGVARANRQMAIVSSCSWMEPPGAVCYGFDRWLLRRIDRLVVQWPNEVEWLKSLGVPQQKLVHIPPSVGCVNGKGATRDFQLPEKARVILCVGPLEPSKGIKDAVWAFHILGFLFPDVYLVLLGEGPEQERLDRLAAGLFPERMIAVGSRHDYGELLARAEVVWVPSLKPRGFNVALEAMAAGKPVVASGLPGLTEIIQDAETGFLFPAGDKVSLAKKTRLILDDPKRGRQMGDTGRRRAQEQFSVESMATAYGKLYESMTR